MLIKGMKKNNNRLCTLDDFVISGASALLRVMHEYFAFKEFIDSAEWELQDINWNLALDNPSENHKTDVRLLMQFMPECIPFDVRALFFTQIVEAER
jgi:hypothetical protein